jgi:hypothetical protein
MFTYLPPHWMKRKQLVFVGSSIEENSNNNVDIKFSAYDEFFGINFIRYAQSQIF